MDVTEFLKAFPEGDIIHISREHFQCPPEIALVPCTELGDKDHNGNLVPGIFFMVTLKKEEPQPDGIPTTDDIT